MNYGKIIVLEGTSNTGKTSACESLSQKAHFRIVPESIRILENLLNDKGDNILFIPKNTEEEIRNQDILFDMEFIKIYAANYFSRQGINVVIDKSALSIVSTAYAFENIGITKSTYNLAEQRLEEFINKMKLHHLRFPDLYVLLETNNEVSKKRNDVRDHVLLNLWNSKKVNEKQTFMLERILRSTNVNFKIIDTTELTKNDVYESIIKSCELSVG